MRVLVAYMSKTGNTKKVAEAIFGEIREEKEIKRIDEVDSLEGYDLAFLGFPVHALGPDKKAKAFLERHTKGNKVVLFITHASPEDHEELPSFLAKFRDAAAGADLLGMFDCQGQLAAGVRFVMRIHPNAKFRAWAKEDNSRGQPDAARLERARVFAREIMAKAS
jgi:flavodoxin